MKGLFNMKKGNIVPGLKLFAVSMFICYDADKT